MNIIDILKQCLWIVKFASRWVPHNFMDMQKSLHYEPALTHLQQNESEADAFLRHIITLQETRTISYEPKIKRHSDELRCVLQVSIETTCLTDVHEIES